MIRFPNPGSDIASFIRIFQTLYTYLADGGHFTLDDMSITLTRMNLAASSGHVGEVALALSTRVDRSRDPLYNQSKMYAELFRTLGWICSSSDRALLFRFTLLGDHVAVADIDPRAIFEESVLGINYPNQILDIRGTEASRVFSTILRTAYRLEGYTCRDEIILGALNSDDNNEDSIKRIVNTLQRLRGKYSQLIEAIQSLSRRISIQVNTLQNYTRFPLSVLTYCGWFEKERTSKFYPGSRNIVMIKMTSYGRERTETLEQSLDIRLQHFEAQTGQKQKSLIRLGFYTMLQRSSFDISSAIAQVTRDKEILKDNLNERELLFSPYQTIHSETADSAFGIRDVSNGVRNDNGENGNTSRLAITYANTYQTTVIRLRQISTNYVTVKTDNTIGVKITRKIQEGLSNNVIASLLFVEYRSVTKEVFYPLIADLFTLIGFSCHASRAGINYERWDAIVVDDQQSIPIEIKSPTEELFISIKAVRQALENKVILLSRNSYITDWDTTTLAVGYYPPNDRAEVSRLISNIRDTFGVKIGVIDFLSLLKISVASVRSEGSLHKGEIRNMEGLIDVESI